MSYEKQKETVDRRRHNCADWKDVVKECDARNDDSSDGAEYKTTLKATIF